MSKFDKDELYLLIDFLEEEKGYCGLGTVYDTTDNIPKFEKVIELIKNIIKESN